MNKEEKKVYQREYMRKVRAGNKDFDLGGFFVKNKKVIAEKLLVNITEGKVKSMELALKILGELNKLKEDKEQTFEPNYDEWATVTLSKLRENWERSGGVCPVCGLPKTLRIGTHLDTEPERTEDREVETLGLPT